MATSIDQALVNRIVGRINLSRSSRFMRAFESRRDSFRKLHCAGGESLARLRARDALGARGGR